MKGLKYKASISFKEFDLARVNNFKDCEKDVAQKKNELQSLKENLDAKIKENNQFKEKIKTQRQKDNIAGHSTNPQCERTSI